MTKLGQGVEVRLHYPRRQDSPICVFGRVGANPVLPAGSQRRRLLLLHQRVLQLIHTLPGQWDSYDSHDSKTLLYSFDSLNKSKDLLDSRT